MSELPLNDKTDYVTHTLIACAFCKRHYLAPCGESQAKSCQNFKFLQSRAKPAAKNDKPKKGKK